MDGTTVILGVIALAAVAGCVWLALGRAALMAAHARDRADRDATLRESDQLRAELARVEVQLSDQRDTLTKVSVDRATLTEQLGAEQEAHRTTRSHLMQEHARILAEQQERLEAEVAHAEKIAQEKLDSVQREKRTILEQQQEFEKRVREAFGSMAADALAKNREQFLALAEQKFEAKTGKIDEMVKPIAETLRKTDAKLAVIEQAGTELRGETSKLVRALREPHVRGRYGEIQLRRVAELAGMSAFCDFAEQDQTPARGQDGAALRPDMIVKMPSGRTVVVDAKTNIQAYLDAINAPTPAEADGHLDRFARHVSEQATALGRKKYWAQYDGSPEFVVMFIPGDQFVDAALIRQPEILETAAQNGVILASPSTLIGLLRAVAVGYKEQQLAAAAAELRELGKELHDRVATAMTHAQRIGKNLNQAADAYNDFVGSYERRLEPVMRKFEDGGVKSAKDLPELPEVTVRAKTSGQAEPASPRALFGAP